MADSRLVYSTEDPDGTKLEVRRIPTNGCLRLSIQSITMRDMGWESVEIPEEDLKKALGYGVCIVSCPIDCKHRGTDWYAEPCLHCEDFNKYEPDKESNL